MSFLKIIKEAYREHGLVGLNKGMGVKLIYNCGAAGIVYTIFNWMRQNYGVDFAD